MPCRVLLTTIPKCGKNLLVSFFTALGLSRRLDDGDLADAASHAQARWMLREQVGQTDSRIAEELLPFLTSTAAAFDRALLALDDLPDTSFVQGHFAYDPELHQRAQETGVTVVFLYRDPRACLASMAHFLVDRGEPASLVPYLSPADLDTALRILLHGNEMVLPFNAVYGPYEGWRDADDVISVRFEDIVGPRGHGSTVTQASTLARLADGIGWTGSRTELLHGILSAFEPRAGTFRRGTLDGWRDDLIPRIDTPALASIDELARQWGYDDQPPAPVSAATDEALTALLTGIHAEHEREAEECARLMEEIILRDRLIERQALKVAEQLDRARRLSLRVDELQSRVVLRMADRVGKGIARLKRRPR